MARPGFEERWRQRFVERGRQFDDDAGIAGWTETGLDTRLRNFRAVWPGDVPGSLWLDAGCGAGSYTRFLAGRGMRAVGLDYSHPSVLKARDRSPDTISWLVGDVTALPVRPSSVDGVMCFGVLQTLTTPDRAIHELFATVRPGGQLWIDALNCDCLSTQIRAFLARRQGRSLNLRYDRPEALVHLLEAAGAEDVRLYWIPILPGAFRLLRPLLEIGPVRALLHRFRPLGSLVSHGFLLGARRSE